MRDAVRRFAREQIAPNAARWDKEHEFPRAALKGLAAMGLYGIAIPEEWGGAGMDKNSKRGQGDDKGGGQAGHRSNDGHGQSGSKTR